MGDEKREPKGGRGEKKGGSLTVEKRGKIFAKLFLPVHKGPIGRVL